MSRMTFRSESASPCARLTVGRLPLAAAAGTAAASPAAPAGTVAVPA